LPGGLEWQNENPGQIACFLAGWHESIALLCAIYEEKGDATEAEAYATLLPEEYKRAYRREAEFSTLCLAYDAKIECHQQSQRVGAEESETLEKVKRSISELEVFLKESYSTDLSNTSFEVKFWREITKDLNLVKPSLDNSTRLFGHQLFTVLHMFALLGLETEAMTWLSISPLHRFLKDESGRTPFELALFAGHVALVSLFLSIPNFQTHSESSPPVSREIDPIDINGCYGVDCYTPLMIACQQQDVSMARFLLSHSDLKYNMTNKNGTTALIVAASYGSLEIVKLSDFSPKFHFK